ncbi:MAG TPA: IS5 family transposase [Gemmataceae bacterium]|nr:IS5 family transposase [Gemmataceae bacterium]
MRQPYPSDLSDNQWGLVVDLFAEAETGRPREVDIRAVVDAIFYVNRTGVQWRYLPHDFPRWDVVHSYLRKWGNDGTWDRMQRRLREAVRQAAGRQATPSMACVDSQSVKGTECGGEHGIDGHKKINGVKRHILVDTMGLLLAVFVTAASVSDAAARTVFGRVSAEEFPRLAKVLGDHVYGYEGLPEWTAAETSFVLKVTVKDAKPGKAKKRKFKVIKWRWVVERTFAWFGRYRRNSRDYEKLPQTSESMLKISIIQMMLRRLAPKEDRFVFHYPKPRKTRQ